MPKFSYNVMTLCINFVCAPCNHNINFYSIHGVHFRVSHTEQLVEDPGRYIAHSTVVHCVEGACTVNPGRHHHNNNRLCIQQPVYYTHMTVIVGNDITNQYVSRLMAN